MGRYVAVRCGFCAVETGIGTTHSHMATQVILVVNRVVVGILSHTALFIVVGLLRQLWWGSEEISEVENAAAQKFWRSTLAVALVVSALDFVAVTYIPGVAVGIMWSAQSWMCVLGRPLFTTWIWATAAGATWAVLLNLLSSTVVV